MNTDFTDSDAVSRITREEQRKMEVFGIRIDRKLKKSLIETYVIIIDIL